MKSFKKRFSEKIIRNMTALLVFFMLLLSGKSSIAQKKDFVQQTLLDKPVRAGSLKVFPLRDDPNTYYYLPNKVRLGTDEKGRPQISFIRFKENVRSGALEKEASQSNGGGYVHLLVGLKVTTEEIEEAEEALKKINPLGKITGPVIYSGGTMTLITKSMLNDGDKKVLGFAAAPSIEGDMVAGSFLLNKNDATLLWESFHTSMPDISFNFNMTISGYQSPVGFKIEMNWDKIYSHDIFNAALATPVLQGDIALAAQQLKESSAIKVTQVGEDANLQRIQDILFNKIILMCFEPFGKEGSPKWEDLAKSSVEGKSYLDRATEQLNAGRKEAIDKNTLIRAENEAERKSAEEANNKSSSEGAAPSVPVPGGSEAKPSEGASPPVPVPGGSEAKPSEGAAPPVPVPGGSEAKPSEGAAPPVPVPGGSEAKPSEGAAPSVPVPGGSEAKPSEGAAPSVPVPGGSETKPSAGAAPSVPVPGGSAAKPSEGGGPSVPVPGGSEAKPSEGAGPSVPVPGGSAAKPSEGAGPSVPVPGGSAAKPSAGATPSVPVPGGSENKPSAPSGAAASMPQQTKAGPAQRKEESVPSFNGIATYQKKQIKHTGRYTAEANTYFPTSLTESFSGNIGKINCKDCLREVDLDDPLYTQREVVCFLDGEISQDFNKYINYVAVTMRKTHAGGDITTDEIRVDRGNFASAGNSFKLMYGWKPGDGDRKNWLNYDYKMVWNFFGGGTIEGNWTSTDVPVVPLKSPVVRRSVTVEGDAEALKQKNIRSVTVKIFYKIGNSEEQFKQASLNVSKGLISVPVDFILPKGQAEYEYEVEWLNTDNRVIKSGRLKTIQDDIYVDVLPS